MSQSESCNSWTEAGFHSPTVSASRLAVPSKASGEYQRACGALKDRKWGATKRSRDGGKVTGNAGSYRGWH